MAQSLALNKKAATASGSFHASIPLDAQERRVGRRKIRELRHTAGVCYLDFIPVLIGARDLGAGATALSIVAGMRAAVVLSIRVLLVRGAGKAN